MGPCVSPCGEAGKAIFVVLGFVFSSKKNTGLASVANILNID